MALRSSRRSASALLFALVAAAALLAGCTSADTGYRWGWYVIDPSLPKGASNLRFLLAGLAATISISLTAICISVVVGVVIASGSLAANPIVRGAARSYIEVFRAIPLLVLLLWVYYGLPVMMGLQFSAFWAGVVTLALSDSAFEAEVFRAGIQAVPRGQLEAGRTLGLSGWQRFRHIVLPQAVRTVLPALGNQFIYVLKMSSLVSIIGYQELTRRANELNVTEYRPLEIYTFLVLEYLALILVASYLVRRLERRMARRGVR